MLLNNVIKTILFFAEKQDMETVSSFDTVGENFYHGFVLGLCAMFDEHYYVTSNRESGLGRYDIQLMPRDKKRPGILIELKSEKNSSEENLKKPAGKALEQIRNRRYDADMRARGIRRMILYGVAFCGKQVEIEVDEA